MIDHMTHAVWRAPLSQEAAIREAHYWAQPDTPYVVYWTNETFDLADRYFYAQAQDVDLRPEQIVYSTADAADNG